MAQNMYRVGDYVYFETQPAAPYQIRRIEELNKTPAGAVEAKVTCFFRRRDLPNSLLKIADQAERQNQIVSKARKTLLASANSGGTVIATTLNGEAETPRENGLEAAVPKQNSSKELEDVKREDDEDSGDSTNAGQHQHSKSYGFAGLPTGAQKLAADQLHELRQRELFLSRIVELLPATQIRGKCTVVILNEVEICDMYLDGHEDAFYYSLVYDPSNQTLLADKGRIELGERHQAVIPDLIVEEVVEKQKTNEEGRETNEKMDSGEDVGGKEMEEEEEEKMQVDEEQPVVSSTTTQQQREETITKTTTKNQQKLAAAAGVEVTERERVVYHPYHNLRDLEIDQFLLIARAVGTFSRALDSSSSTKLPTLHQTASAASRDITLLHAMALLHQANYDLGQAAKYLVPPADKQHYPLEADKLTAHNTSNLGGPILCRDQLEEWSASESTLFEDAIEKYGKDFHDIRQDCLPWKSMRDIVEYYYMWKTTSRYAELQKAKHAEQENKLKQVYIPNYNKPNVNLIGTLGAKNNIGGLVPCESCGASNTTTSTKTESQTTTPAHWYFWGPAQQFRVCGECWMVWKKRGGLKKPHSFDTFDLENGNNDGRQGGGGGTNRLGTGRNGLPQQVLQRGTAGQILIGQKGRVAFFLNSPLETRVARRMAPKPVFNVRKAARAPFHDIDQKGVQDFYFGRPITDVLHMARQVMKRGTLTHGAIEHLSNLHRKRMATVEQNGKK